MKKIGFIGVGNMGSALVLAASKSEDIDILITDKLASKVDQLASDLKVTASDAVTIASECDLIFIGVKPSFVTAALEEILPYIKERNEKPTLVSMAAGVSIKSIGERSEMLCPVIRIMPNTPVSVGEGMIVYDACPAVTNEAEELFLHVMKHAGRLDRVPESLIDASSALSGCGPAFVFMFIESLADGAVACGLPRDKALAYAEQTVLGAAKLALESGKHPGELKDAVCSPGGSTIEGVRTLEESAFRAAAVDAVIASYEKTRTLGK